MYYIDLLLNWIMRKSDLFAVLNNEIEELRNLSVKDQLTNLYNRRGLMERLVAEISRAIRLKDVISVIMIDIDEFKTLNDMFGHLYGDKILVEIASILKRVTREIDTVSRFGGDEFIIICPDMNDNGVSVLTERILKGVRNLQINGFITVSIGTYTTSPPPTLNIYTYAKTMIEKVDRCLYKSKEEGKDRITLRSDLK